jgi:hypothetical protein
VTEHKHSPFEWNGYYERCRCDALAGDQRDPATGQRYTTFKERGE